MAAGGGSCVLDVCEETDGLGGVSGVQDIGAGKDCPGGGA